MLTKVFDNFYSDIIQSEARSRKCVTEKFKDSAEEATNSNSNHFLSQKELGSDCALDIGKGNIDNACQKLDAFLVWAYEDCNTKGEKLLEQLRSKCNKINEIRNMIADKE